MTMMSQRRLNSLDRARLELLRKLDSIIDFSKSTIQLQIILALALNGENLSTSRLSKIVGERRKAVLDALRKLEYKGLIRRVDGSDSGELVYELTDLGRAFTRGLAGLLSSTPASAKAQHMLGEDLTVSQRITLRTRLVEAGYAYKALVALSLAPRYSLPARDLSRSLGISAERLVSYMDLFTTPPQRIFRKMLKPDGTIIYRLDAEGAKLLARIAESRKLRSRRLAVALARAFKAYSQPKIIAVMSSVLFLANSLAMLLLYLVSQTKAEIVGSILSLVSAFFMYIYWVRS
jgi:DNA-binding MarR family transcriptional regulator